MVGVSHHGSRLKVVAGMTALWVVAPSFGIVIPVALQTGIHRVFRKAIPSVVAATRYCNSSSKGSDTGS